MRSTGRSASTRSSRTTRARFRARASSSSCSRASRLRLRALRGAHRESDPLRLGRAGSAGGHKARDLGRVPVLRGLLEVAGEGDNLVALVAVRLPVVAILVRRVQVLELADILLGDDAGVLGERDDVVEGVRRAERVDALV